MPDRLPFVIALFIVAVLSGVTASVAGFGNGSLLTPLLATRVGMTAAVAVVAIPHALATAVRCWRLRAHIDWNVLRSFGVLSAAGALIGALLYSRASSRTLTLVLAVLLIATAIAGLTDWTQRWRPNKVTAGAFGFASGLFGGVAGNQRGLRSAAPFAFPLTPLAFVATSTAAGVLVDAARVPVYIWRASETLRALSPLIVVAAVGVLIGTVAGERVLLGLSRDWFRKIVSALIGLLGVWLLVRYA